MSMTAELVRSRAWDVRFDEGRHARANIGFVLLPNEQTIESDLFRMAPPGVGLHFSRGPMPREVNVENLASMADTMAETAALLLPDDDLDVICYACTSGSVVIGEDRVRAELSRGRPGPKPTTLVSGVIAGLGAFGARRIVVGTPYLDEVNAIEATYLEERGFEILDIQGMNLQFDAEMVRVAPEFLVEFAVAIDHPDADAVFISCGALRTIEVIDEIERKIGKPVITSNQGMFWYCLRLAGIDDRIQGFGRLFLEY